MNRGFGPLQGKSNRGCFILGSDSISPSQNFPLKESSFQLAGHSLWRSHFGVEHPFASYLMFPRNTTGFDPQPSFFSKTDRHFPQGFRRFSRKQHPVQNGTGSYPQKF